MSWARVVFDELVRTGSCPATGGGLSGLFLIGEVRLGELGSGAHLLKEVSGGEEYVPRHVPGGVVEDLVLSDGLVIVLVASRGCCLNVGLEAEG